MSFYDVRVARRGRSLRRKAILAMYVLAIALLPLTHHDVACHLKSSVHCTTCLIGSAADLALHETSLGSSSLNEAGRPAIEARQCVDWPSIPAAPGRAPPALSL
jgi:hypothetical protein